ncbi:hypothetical protein [Roseibium sediminicola]|uniref:Uncharacterized protein n=1 Tax=Roseibium sediminicola TaxID=2933272 RepID=A0ABT0GW21_9HYPH|nr:hypothetical protein [Roseibium sp. CAU 1639]MCK7613642.1 hypothetical protein [Roseibium sp. CAU 1639]
MAFSRFSGSRLMADLAAAGSEIPGYARPYKACWVAALLFVSVAYPASAQETTVTEYFDDRSGAMALNYDTELYLCGMIHSSKGHDPVNSAVRAARTRVGWPNLLEDAETYGIPQTFNLCGHDAVFGDDGPGDLAKLDQFNLFHRDKHWWTNTWYSDAPPNGGDYRTVGDLSGYTRSYGLVYGGDMTEAAMNASVPHEISFHTFGHGGLNKLPGYILDETFRVGKIYHKRIGNKITAQAPPWNGNPIEARYPIFVDHGIFLYNRFEETTAKPHEVIENLWVIARHRGFDADTDLRDDIDAVIAAGHVLAPYSHPEDGFAKPSRDGFQKTLAHAQAKVQSGELWATTLSEIGRYCEAKSDVGTVTRSGEGATTVEITLNDYKTETFGIPYLTFKSPMPDGSEFARISVDFPSDLTLNSNSDTVRVEDGLAVYSIYLNPNGPTNVRIEGVSAPHTDGVDINTPVLTVTTVAPTEPPSATPVKIQAQTESTDTIYTVNLIYQHNTGAKKSAIMTGKNGAWETEIGPFNPGDWVTYYVSATDNTARRVTTPLQRFLVRAETSE